MSAFAPVNNVIPFSLVDGPGARTSIFLQGCNIRCAYCHNPETQNLCVGCGACVDACPAGALELSGGKVAWDSEKCVKCDTCINVCEHHASPRVTYRSARELFEQAASYAPFIRGVTVSGGECMLYPDFLLELFELCRKAGLGRLIDSNGTIDFSDHLDLLDAADGVMLDVKSWDDAWFEKLTGRDGSMVRKNLSLLAEMGKLEEVRVIVTEGWNDPEDVVRGIARTLGAKVGETRIRLMRFHPFGVKGEMESAPSPSDARMDDIERLARDLGFGTVTVS